MAIRYNTYNEEHTLTVGNIIPDKPEMPMDTTIIPSDNTKFDSLNLDKYFDKDEDNSGVIPMSMESGLLQIERILNEAPEPHEGLDMSFAENGMNMIRNIMMNGSLDNIMETDLNNLMASIDEATEFKSQAQLQAEAAIKKTLISFTESEIKKYFDIAPFTEEQKMYFEGIIPDEEIRDATTKDKIETILQKVANAPSADTTLIKLIKALSAILAAGFTLGLLIDFLSAGATLGGPFGILTAIFGLPIIGFFTYDIVEWLLTKVVSLVIRGDFKLHSSFDKENTILSCISTLEAYMYIAKKNGNLKQYKLLQSLRDRCELERGKYDKSSMRLVP